MTWIPEQYKQKVKVPLPPKPASYYSIVGIQRIGLILSSLHAKPCVRCKGQCMMAVGGWVWVDTVDDLM